MRNFKVNMADTHALEKITESEPPLNPNNMATPAKPKLTKKDAETIALGQQISGGLGNRLRSTSGKIYHLELSVSSERQSQIGCGMDSIEEVVRRGGIDHAKPYDHENDEESTEENSHSSCATGSKCCSNTNQLINLIQQL